jgi:hypothetical protein
MLHHRAASPRLYRPPGLLSRSSFVQLSSPSQGSRSPQLAQANCRVSLITLEAEPNWRHCPRYTEPELDRSFNRASETSSLSSYFSQPEHHKPFSAAPQVCKNVVYSHETNTINHNSISLIHILFQMLQYHKDYTSAKVLAG